VTAGPDAGLRPSTLCRRSSWGWPDAAMDITAGPNAGLRLSALIAEMGGLMRPGEGLQGLMRFCVLPPTTASPRFLLSLTAFQAAYPNQGKKFLQCEPVANLEKKTGTSYSSLR
jgi:hypothetical protein